MSSSNPNNGSTNTAGHKRKSSELVDHTPRKIPRRNQVKPVKVEREEFWDKYTHQAMTKEEIKRKFIRAARRSGQLDSYNLLYKYVRIKATEIRLLEIEPAKKLESDLFVSIRQFSDSEVGTYPLQEYEALSYHWGPGPADKAVYISRRESLPKIDIGDLTRLRSFVPDWDKGQRFYVRPNLDKALRRLRHPTETIVLWVDAICINQNDVKGEKPEQIAKMKHIYNKAVNVCIWLGDGKVEGKDRSKDFHAAMKFSQEILKLKELEKLAQDTQATKSWSNLLDLMRCSWFSRRWVIQELALAREATVHCGDLHVPWQEFADAIGLFALNFDRIRALFRRSQDDKIFRNYRNFNELEPLGAKVLVDAVTNTFRKNVDDSILEPVSDLETLVSSLSFFESSDPRDTIYALLNIAKESIMPESQGTNAVGPPKPNYESNILEVYTDFLEYVVCSSGSLDIICRHWAIPERDKPGGWKNATPVITLPSWIQTISKSPWGFQEQGFNGRINGDSIVGKAGRRRYNASRWKKPDVRFGQRQVLESKGKQLTRVNSAPPVFGARGDFTRAPESFGGPPGRTSPFHRLYVKGIEIGSVTWTSGPVSRGVITKECLEKGGWKNNGMDLTRVPDKLWRTLVADRNAEGENPPPWYHRAALHCMAFVDNNGHIGTSALLDHGNSADGRLPYIVAEYLKRAQAITWNRKFIEGNLHIRNLKEHNVEPLFGLGPPETQHSDRICILFGCSVPCILRPCTFRNGTKYFEFIGEAYIHGRMDGEAIAMLSDEKVKTMTMEFVII
ncbi:HET-domain-containing protein [Lojkania enalia]|uniref:HET-domain-containing protein n=1 Tax=Lojkania enalia TaxID=147567 RepID=A0A9P4TPR5_9PLEO|nr:HET-domain-containing protein [Didymosphaeria enalia]